MEKSRQKERDVTALAKRDYYQVLGVAKTATETEVKSAYRKLARTHHPDVDNSPGAAEKFKEISEAYQILSDPQKRQSYDQFGHAGPNPFSSGGNPFGGGFRYSTGGQGPNVQFDFGNFEDPFELFNQVFGGGFGQHAQRRPIYQLQISFDEAIKGVAKQVEITDPQGKRSRMTIRVPAGVDNGTRMRFGDLDISFQVSRHAEFLREGADIFSDLHLSIPQAVLGDTIEVNTVWGKVKLKVPTGTQPGSLIRLKGKGVNHLSESSKGDHYVRVNLAVPKKLTSEEKKIYEDLMSLGSSKKSWF